MPSLDTLNAATAGDFTAALAGVYEHSPWIAARAAARRPFASTAALKLALQTVVDEASADERLALLRAHPELAGKAAVADELTAASREEQAASGLHLCSEGEYATLHRLNAAYNARFGFPFILAIRGPDGQGLPRRAIIDHFARRLQQPPAAELAEALRQVHRIAELRLHELLGDTLLFGPRILQWADTLAMFSDDAGALTCAYLTAAHRRTAAQLAEWMREAGMSVHIDAVGNVIGRYNAATPDAPTLLTGSHYDTVRDAGKYDGRLGILLPLAVVQHLAARGERLPFHLEVIGFAEEEGLRFRSTFLGSSALAGRFDPAVLGLRDADGICLREALAGAGHDPSAIGALARDPASLLGFLEVHIEQGPVLLERGLPLGVVSAIAGSTRLRIDLTGQASHAGTTPMHLRRDAAAAAAEIVLLVERCCSGRGSLVGTVGQLDVPGGAVNVVPGACRLSLDLRAADDAVRHAALAELRDGMRAICERRQIGLHIDILLDAPAVACAPRLRAQLAAAIERTGLPAPSLPSGAGHDAMMLASLTPVAMLFTRCGNGGISHNPLETMTADDADLAARVFLDVLRTLT